MRLQAEYEQAHAQQALNMPLHLLRLKVRLLDKSKTHLCYCDSGKRSASAVFLLSQLAFSAYALRDGLDALPAVQRAGLLCESGPGYLARSGGAPSAATEELIDEIPMDLDCAVAGWLAEPESPSQFYERYNQRVIDGISFADDAAHFSARKRAQVEARLAALPAGESGREQMIASYLQFFS